MWQITTDLETDVMVAVLEVLYLGSAQIPQALIVLYRVAAINPEFFSSFF
jgi:hypothetical protein